MGALKIAIVGNCQAKQIEGLLRIVSRDLISVQRTKSVHVLTESDRAEFIDTIKNCDVVITHPISSTFPIEYARTVNLKAFALDAGVSVFLLSNIYSTSYNTSCSYLLDPLTQKRIQGPLDGIHFPSIYRCFIEGRSKSMARNAYLGISRTEVFGAINSSIAELMRRDHENGIDIPIAMLLKNLMSSAQLLHTFHHPTVDLISLVVRQLHRFLDISPPASLHPMLVNDDVILNQSIHIAAHPASLEVLGATFVPCEFFRSFSAWNIENYHSIQLLDPSLFRLEEVIDLFYAFYGDLSANSCDLDSFIMKFY